jgi:hypothetical protein
VLRAAGLVEIPGTGSFEEPAVAEGLSRDATAPPVSPWSRPSRATVWGFLVVAMVAGGLVGLVQLVAGWLAGGYDGLG